MANKIIVQQLRSNKIYNTGNAKLPKSTDFNENEQYKYGTLALNYHKEQESITTINDENQVIAFNYNLNLTSDSSDIEEQVYEIIKTAKGITINNEWIITHRIINEGIITLLGGCFNNNKIEYIKVIITADKKYTKEISEIEFNAENISYKENINVKAALDELFKEIDNINSNKLTINKGEGINIEGEGTEKTISANFDLNIVTVEGKEMLQLVDGSDNSKVIAEVDASEFVVDGMLSSAEIFTVDDETELPEGVELPNGKYIKLTWNTDAVKTDTYISVADLISEHKVVAGEDVAGEFVVVATNVVESTDENGIKVSTVNVTVDDSAVKSALNKKIGKDDVMLSFGGKNETYVLNRSTSETPVVLTGSSWRVEFECDHDFYDIKLKNSKGEDVISYSGTTMYGTMGYIQHDNGVLTSDVFENPSERQIDPNESYSIELIGSTHQYYEEQVTLTVKVKSNESQQVFNTEESIQYLNENKADKVFVEEHSNNTDLHVTQALQEKWNNSVEKSHTHLNKTEIDNINVGDVNKWNEYVNTLKISVEEQGSNNEDTIFKQYIIKQGNEEVKTINIPKDLVVESGSIITATDVDKTNDSSVVVGDTYLKLILNSSTANPIYIAVKDLVDVYTADETYIKESNNKFSLDFNKIDQQLMNSGAVGQQFLNLNNLISNVGNKANQAQNEVDALESVVTEFKEDYNDTIANISGNIIALQTDKANESDVNTSLELKANKTDVYTKSECDEKFLTEHQDISHLATKEEVNEVEQGINNKIDVEINGTNTKISNETSRATEKENELEASINNLNEELIKDEKVIRAAFEDVYYNKPINYAINTSVPYEGRCKKDAFDNYAVSQFTSNTYYGAKGLKGGDTITVTFDIEIDNTEWLDRTVDYDDVTGQHQTGLISLQMGPRWGYMSLSNVRFTESGKYHVSSTLQIPLKDYSKPTPVTEDIIGDVYVRYSYVKPIDESKPMIKITNFRINKGSKDMGWTPSVFDSEYNLGCNNITLTTSQILPINKRLCNVVLSGTSVTKNITFGMHYDSILDATTLLHAVNGQENHYIIYNSMSTDVTLTLPNTSNIVLLSGSSLTISPNSYAELNCIIVDDGVKTNLENQGRMYIRAIV